MIANPKAPTIEVLNGLEVEDQTVSIRHFPSLDIFVAGVDDVPEGVANVVARSSSSRALARWALDRGAKAVRHDYDLRLER